MYLEAMDLALEAIEAIATMTMAAVIFVGIGLGAVWTHLRSRPK